MVQVEERPQAHFREAQIGAARGRGERFRDAARIVRHGAGQAAIRHDARLVEFRLIGGRLVAIKN